MKAIEINSKTDKSGNLRIDYKLDKAQKKVRVLILIDDDYSETNEEETWLKAVSENPAFDFLNDEDEDIYTVNDGEPFLFGSHQKTT